MVKTKRVRFDFYTAVMCLSPTFDKRAQRVAASVEKYSGATSRAGKEKLEKYRAELRAIQEQHETARTGYWDIASLVEYACSDGRQIVSPSSGGDLLEIDKDTYYHDEEDLVAFQVTTLRSHDIPAKKRLGETRSDVPLEDDEYLGEFTQVIYDRRFHVVAIQSNKHGASPRAIQFLLNEIDRNMRPDRVENGAFEPLLNHEMIDRVQQAQAYKRITIKCSDANYGVTKATEHFTHAREILDPTVDGWTMELTVSFSGTRKTQTLDRQKVREIVDSFREVHGNPELSPEAKEQYEVDVTYYDDTTQRYETVDLLTPKIHFFVEVKIEERKVIGSQYMYDLVIEAYRKKEGILFAVLRHLV